MPKLRNGITDVQKFAQWLGRKCRNHHPLEELSKLNAGKLPNIYRASSKAHVEIVGEDATTLIYAAGGRMFAVHVEEVTDRQRLTALEEQKEERLVEVGY